MPRATKVPKAGASGSSSKKVIQGAGKGSSHHPTFVDMILVAVQVTTENKKAASLHVIKKYLGSAYNVDVEKQGHFIRNALRRAVEEGQLVQVSGQGNGVSGSFRLPRGGGGAAAQAGGRKPRAKKATSTRTAPAPRKPKVKRVKRSLATPVESTVKKEFKAARIMAAPTGHRPVKQEFRAGSGYRDVKPFALVKKERRSGN